MGRRELTPAEIRAYRALARAARKLGQAQKEAEQQRRDRAHDVESQGERGGVEHA